MSSFRDKIKFATPTTQKQKQQSNQSITSFDETWLKINVVGGQSQLCPIKLNCLWSVPNVSNRPPELSCKWFNKTENSMNTIDQVCGSYYQPCLQDVGTIIHVQCMPQLEGVQYEGMPIIKQIGPVKIDPETEQEANDLLQASKATFSIKIKNSQTETVYHEGLIKIQGNHFRLISKLKDPEKQIANVEICESSLALKCSRNKPKELEILINKQHNKDKILVQLSNNKIRDVLVLLVKLISVKNVVAQQNNNEEQQLYKIKNQQKREISTQNDHKKQQDITQTAESLEEQRRQEITEKSQQIAEMVKKNEMQAHTKSTQKQRSQPDNKSSKKSQMSQQQLHQENISKKDIKKVIQMKSTEDLSTAMSPIIKKGGSKLQKPSLTTTPSNNKHNALQILQISDLKKELRAQQGEILHLKKTITQKNQIISHLNQQIQHMKERQANLSCNYFQLEQQVKKTKQNSQKSSEQVSYYKNQNRILKTDLQNSHKKNKSLIQQVDQLTQKLSPFLQETEQQEQQVQSYAQIKQKYQNQVKIKQQVQAKYQYIKQQSMKIQQKFNEVKQILDKVQNEKNFYKKKYENISQELQSQNSSVHQPITSCPVSQVKLIKEKSMLGSKNSIQSVQQQEQQKIEQASIYEQFIKLQKQTLDLKRHLKQTIEENNFLRSVNAASTKDKKSSSSKQTLKLQLVQMKKIVNRLTEALTEKDMALDNMKLVNKDLNQKLLEAIRKIDQFQKQATLQDQNLKHGYSYE